MAAACSGGDGGIDAAWQRDVESTPWLDGCGFGESGKNTAGDENLGDGGVVVEERADRRRHGGARRGQRSDAVMVSSDFWAAERLEDGAAWALMKAAMSSRGSCGGWGGRRQRKSLGSWVCNLELLLEVVI
ncbi:hypothetical protein M0R45_035622 [Rubus argutus]|uniref:Uncharacterized protein n=1 Tax=Rubus argutus TaxID=59490 RepID=A0AAW1VW80_RUBAR